MLQKNCMTRCGNSSSSTHVNPGSFAARSAQHLPPARPLPQHHPFITIPYLQPGNYHEKALKNLFIKNFNCQINNYSKLIANLLSTYMELAVFHY
jgi:hypothetical protein